MVTLDISLYLVGQEIPRVSFFVSLADSWHDPGVL